MTTTAVNETPVLFSGPMVLALRRKEHAKTQTRRIVKGSGEFQFIGACGDSKADPGNWGVLNDEGEYCTLIRGSMSDHYLACPYGKPGDILLVKEAHYLERVMVGRRLRGVKCIYEADGECYAWTLDDLPAAVVQKLRAYKNWGRRRAGRFLFGCMVRERREIVSVRVQRMQEISDTDCLAEGILQLDMHAGGKVIPHFGLHGWAEMGLTPRDGFQILLELVGRGHAWKDNLWTWVVEFKRWEAA